MLMTEPPLGRRTARAEFGLDVFDARAPLLVDDPAALPAVGVVVGAACEVRQDISDEDHGATECDWG